MITKEGILKIIRGLLKEKDIFLVSVDIGRTHNIRVVVDSIHGLPVSDCVDISRTIEQNLDRDVADFEIEVTSPGLGSPFKVKEQYLKNIGREIEVILKDGRTLKGLLVGTGDDQFCIEQEKKVKIEGKKKKGIIKERHEFAYNDVSKARNIVKM